MDPPVFVSLISDIGMGFFGLAGGWWGVKTVTTLLKSQPALVIDSESLCDHSSSLAAGHLSWTDIEWIALVTGMGT